MAEEKKEIQKISEVFREASKTRDKIVVRNFDSGQRGTLWDICDNLVETTENVLIDLDKYDKEKSFSEFVLRQVDLALIEQFLSLVKDGKIDPSLEKMAHDLYQQCKQMLEPIAAMLLCFSPDGTPATIKEFKALLLDTHKRSKDAEKNNLAILRFLGQAVYGQDAEIGLEAVKILDGIDMNAVGLDKTSERLQMAALIYLAFLVLPNLVMSQRASLVGKYGWLAIYFNFPLAEWLKSYLADQPDLIGYINNSGEFAQGLLNSHSSLIFKEGVAQRTIGQFLQKFVITAGKDDIKTEKQQDYVDVEIGLNKSRPESEYLKDLLSLYINLRECTLIDYRGLLSDEKVLTKKFDWKKIIQNDLSDDLLEEIRKYWQELHRPFRTKMELVGALREFSWSDEPYLSRILALNDLFEEVCGHAFFPIVYFDENSSEWRIDTESRKELLKKIEASIKKYS